MTIYCQKCKRTLIIHPADVAKGNSITGKRWYEKGKEHGWLCNRCIRYNLDYKQAIFWTVEGYNKLTGKQ